MQTPYEVTRETPDLSATTVATFLFRSDAIKYTDDSNELEQGKARYRFIDYTYLNTK